MREFQNGQPIVPINEWLDFQQITYLIAKFTKEKNFNKQNVAVSMDIVPAENPEINIGDASNNEGNSKSMKFFGFRCISDEESPPVYRGCYPSDPKVRTMRFEAVMEDEPSEEEIADCLADELVRTHVSAVKHIIKELRADQKPLEEQFHPLLINEDNVCDVAKNFALNLQGKNSWLMKQKYKYGCAPILKAAKVVHNFGEKEKRKACYSILSFVKNHCDCLLALNKKIKYPSCICKNCLEVNNQS